MIADSGGSDPAAASNFCAWLAKTEGSQIGAIEVCNEPKFLDPLSGESVPVGSYGYSEAGTQLRIDNFPVSSSPKLIMMK
jgi:hypothetical protein